MAETRFDPLAILATLNRHDVAYVAIGGFAATLHGSPLRTDDVDVCPGRDDANLERLAAALSELDARIATPDEPRGVALPHEAEFIGRIGIWNLVTSYGRLDISFLPSGTQGYEDLRRNAIEYDVGGGLIVPTAALLDVIRSKEAAGREKDRRSLPVLRRLLEEFDARDG